MHTCFCCPNIYNYALLLCLSLTFTLLSVSFFSLPRSVSLSSPHPSPVRINIEDLYCKDSTFLSGYFVFVTTEFGLLSSVTALFIWFFVLGNRFLNLLSLYWSCVLPYPSTNFKIPHYLAEILSLK